MNAENRTITLHLDDGRSQHNANVPPIKSSLSAKPAVNAACAVLMDPQTGVVLYSKNAHLRRPNASTTKMMTAILLIENCQMDDIVTASKKASETQFTSIHLKPGEKITVRDLLYGMMIRSANDAAVAAAEHIAGSTSKFAVMMNKKAREIGCRDTHFVTPNGLYAKGHYSSAYDLCLMARYAMKYPIFNEVVNTRKYVLSSRTINKKDMVVFCRSRFMKDYYGADGIKSGYIKQAGYCYVGSATRDGWRIVSAVLKSNNAGHDTAAMMDYAFANYMPVSVTSSNSVCGHAPVNGGTQKTVALHTKSDFRVIIPKTGAAVTTKMTLKPIEAPVSQGDRLGKMVAYVNGHTAGSIDLQTVGDIQISLARRFWGFAGTSGLILACLVVGGKYGTAIAKNTRRRRRRVTASLRDFDRYR
ncbi:D-alanyl-D-alanine carboxypeptidase [bacterium]|nr:D-alanyl-D-alanine carboxypeptidase [bacterium]